MKLKHSINNTPHTPGLLKILVAPFLGFAPPCTLPGDGEGEGYWSPRELGGRKTSQNQFKKVWEYRMTMGKSVWLLRQRLGDGALAVVKVSR